MKANVGLFSAVFLALAGCVSEYGEMTSRKPAGLTSGQVSTVRATVADALKDPGSAQFRPFRAIKVGFDSGAEFTYVCGTVNAKNSFGGYVGFSAFHGKFVEGGRFELINLDSGDGWFSDMFCRETLGIPVK